MEWRHSSTSCKVVPGCDDAVDKIFCLLGTQRPPYICSSVTHPVSPSTIIAYPRAEHPAPAPGFMGGSEPPVPKCASWLHPETTNIVVNQNYYVAPDQLNGAADMNTGRGDPSAYTPRHIAKLRLGSVANLATGLLPVNIPPIFDDRRASCHSCGTTLLNQGAALYDQMSSTFDILMTAIDRDHYDGLEATCGTPEAPTSAPTASKETSLRQSACSHSKGPTPRTVASMMSKNYFAKADYYANSRLPLNLPPMKLYIASYQLLSLAAQYSDRAYLRPQGAERFAHIGADWRAGTKAMVIKSVPMDDANIIVFAIRGTSNFMDWAVNLNMAPTPPVGFLDDPGNLCHAGFLSVARKMIHPVAVRLRQLLEEDPRRTSYSLLITGHSAGGAVASLLYAHMVASSTQAASELNLLTGCFRRVHCITFGAPPVSLLPLKKPERLDLIKSLFFSFVNEGDPVVRADREYVKSLIGLFSTFTPELNKSRSVNKVATNASRSALLMGWSGPHDNLESSASSTSIRSTKSMKSNSSSKPAGSYRPTHGASEERGGSSSSHKGCRGDGACSTDRRKPVWKVPPSTLSNAGRIVVLRTGNPRWKAGGNKTIEEFLRQGVVAQFTSDEQLRSVVWGDPVCHAMKLYAGRIEILAGAAMMIGL